MKKGWRYLQIPSDSASVMQPIDENSWKIPFGEVEELKRVCRQTELVWASGVCQKLLTRITGTTGETIGNNETAIGTQAAVHCMAWICLFLPQMKRPGCLPRQGSGGRMLLWHGNIRIDFCDMNGTSWPAFSCIVISTSAFKRLAANVCWAAVSVYWLCAALELAARSILLIIRCTTDSHDKPFRLCHSRKYWQVSI